jgi:hypothetical protein
MKRTHPLTFCIALCVWARTRAAEAQLHADVDLEAGAMQRLLSSRPAGQGNPSVGPMFDLSGHVAILPLLRAGAYVSFDLAPLGGQDTREILSAGLSGRLYSPWPRGAWRAWLSLGFGYAAARAPSFGPIATTTGGFFEVPVGIGASVRLSRSFELIGDLGTRIGFGFSGNMYNRTPTPLAGDDSFGVFVVLGVAYEL